jgi:hypothetical protein
MIDKSVAALQQSFFSAGNTRGFCSVHWGLKNPPTSGEPFIRSSRALASWGRFEEAAPGYSTRAAMRALLRNHLELNRHLKTAFGRSFCLPFFVALALSSAQAAPLSLTVFGA